MLYFEKFIEVHSLIDQHKYVSSYLFIPINNYDDIQTFSLCSCSVPDVRSTFNVCMSSQSFFQVSCMCEEIFSIHNFITYKKIQTSVKKALYNNYASKVGGKTTPTRLVTANISTYNTVHFHNTTSF